MSKSIHTIRAIRNGKTVQLEVEAHKNQHCDLYWIKKADGKPLYGTTGYFTAGSKDILTYRGRVLLKNVEWL